MIHIFKDILPLEKAEDLLDNVNSMPESELSLAYFLLNNGPFYLKNVLSDNNTKIANDSLLAHSLKENGFTYRFRRTVGQPRGFLKDFYLEYLQKDLKTFIQNNTKFINVAPAEVFLSVYGQGDFLSTHHDHNKGDLAFVLNLTKNWRPEYGGLLHVLQEDGTYKAVNPEFNSLVIMELPAEGVAHFVSEVTKYAPKPRIAISGWYTETKDR